MTEWIKFEDNPPTLLQQIWAYTESGDVLAITNYPGAVEGNDITTPITHWQPLDEEMFKRGELPEAPK